MIRRFISNDAIFEINIKTFLLYVDCGKMSNTHKMCIVCTILYIMYNRHLVNCQTHMFRKIIILLYYNIRIVVTGVVKCQTNIIIYFRFFLALRFGDITFSDITVTIMFQLNSNIIKTILCIIGTLWLNVKHT